MSENPPEQDDGEQIGTRQEAVRMFTGEIQRVSRKFREDESDDRSTKFVLLPSGGKANRVFLVGTLTETEEASEGNWRGRITDPTGALNFYAGDYEPKSVKNALENATPPHYVSLVGKPDTYETDDGDVIATLRPETVVFLDSGGDDDAAATRSRWVQETAEHTLDRIEQEAEDFDLTGVEDADERVDVLLNQGKFVQASEEHYGNRGEIAELAVQALESLETTEE